VVRLAAGELFKSLSCKAKIREETINRSYLDTLHVLHFPLNLKVPIAQPSAGSLIEHCAHANVLIRDVDNATIQRIFFMICVLESL
jgi:hypothetical protein